MPIAKELRTDPALEAQVFWFKYRREIAILFILAIVAVFAIAGYRFYRDRREATAATLFGAAKTPAAYEEVIIAMATPLPLPPHICCWRMGSENRRSIRKRMQRG